LKEELGAAQALGDLINEPIFARARSNRSRTHPRPNPLGEDRMTEHVLEKLAATNPDAEIWWDSSPLIYPSWKEETLAKAPDGEQADWQAQLTRFYDDGTIQSQGTMGFRGVTTNPPL